MVSRNFDAAKLLQMGSKPLRVKQCEFLRPKIFYKRDQLNLGSIADPLEH
jgi:hypothetical protein